MIQANELRIGNWVNLISLDQKIQIESISKTETGGLFTWIYNKEEYEDSLSAVEPIPLIPEILEKCGFEKYGDSKFFDYRLIAKIGLKEICFYTTGITGVFFIERVQDIIRLPLEILYLHQLQNLYFALTGTELTIII